MASLLLPNSNEDCLEADSYFYENMVPAMIQEISVDDKKSTHVELRGSTPTLPTAKVIERTKLSRNLLSPTSMKKLEDGERIEGQSKKGI